MILLVGTIVTSIDLTFVLGLVRVFDVDFGIGDGEGLRSVPGLFIRRSVHDENRVIQQQNCRSQQKGNPPSRQRLLQSKSIQFDRKSLNISMKMVIIRYVLLNYHYSMKIGNLTLTIYYVIIYYSIIIILWKWFNISMTMII